MIVTASLLLYVVAVFSLKPDTCILSASSTCAPVHFSSTTSQSVDWFLDVVD
jgi:hypothetical protein